jgi:hypothetical protein
VSRLLTSLELAVAVLCFGEPIEVERGATVHWANFEMADDPAHS